MAAVCSAAAAARRGRPAVASLAEAGYVREADDLDGDNTIGSTDFSIFTSNYLHSLPNTSLLS